MDAVDNSNLLEDSDLPNPLNTNDNSAVDFENDDSTRVCSCTSSSGNEVPRIFSNKSPLNTTTPTTSSLKTQSSKKEDSSCTPGCGFFRNVMENAKSILSSRCSSGNEEPTKDIEEEDDLSVGDDKQWSTGSSKCVEFHTLINSTDSASCTCDEESADKNDSNADTYTNDIRDETYSYSKTTTPSSATCSCRTSVSSGNLNDVSKTTTVSKNTTSSKRSSILKNNRDISCCCSVPFAKEMSEKMTSCNCSCAAVTPKPPVQFATSCGCCTANVPVSNKNYQFSVDQTAVSCECSLVTPKPPVKYETSSAWSTANVPVSNKNYQFSVDQGAVFCQCSLPKPPVKDTKGLQKSLENVECCRCRSNRYSDAETKNIATYKSHICPGCSPFHDCPSCAANSKKAIETNTTATNCPGCSPFYDCPTCAANSKKAIETKSMATTAMTKELKDSNVQFGQPCPVKVDRCITTPNIPISNRVNPNIPASIRSDRKRSCSENTCPTHLNRANPNIPIRNFMNPNIYGSNRSRSETRNNCTEITCPAHMKVTKPNIPIPNLPNPNIPTSNRSMTSQSCTQNTCPAHQHLANQKIPATSLVNPNIAAASRSEKIESCTQITCPSYQNLPNKNIPGSNFVNQNTAVENRSGKEESCTQITCPNLPNQNIPASNLMNQHIATENRSGKEESCTQITCPNLANQNIPASNLMNQHIAAENRSGKEESCTQITCPNLANPNIPSSSVSERTESCTQITCPAINFKDEDNQCAFLGSPIIGSSTTRNISMTKSVGVECTCNPRTRSNPMIAELNQQERNYRSQIEVFAERGKHYDAAFNNYQHMMNRPPCCCRPTDRGDPQSEIQRISRELKLENKTLRAELMEMKMELKHTLEKVEGPMKRKLEMERVKCEKLQYDLNDASRNRMADRDSRMMEMNSLNMQLCCACSNMTELNSINQRLKEELNSLDCMCNKLEDDLTRQKLSESTTIRKLTKKMPCSCSQGDKENPFDSMFNSGQISKDSFKCDSNLHTIARNLSRTLKESAPCEECSQLPEELVGAAKCIKELTDLVQSKKASFNKDTSREISKETSKKDTSSQSKPLTDSTGCQCVGKKDATTGESRVMKESSRSFSPFSKDSFKCDSNLDAIARKLSKTIKESAPCEECSQFPPELTGAAKYIKDLTDLVQSRKVQQRDASAGGSRATSPRRRQDDTTTKTIFEVPPGAFVEMDDSTQMMKPSFGADTRAQSSYFSAQNYNPSDAICEAPCAPPRPPNVFSFGNQGVSETPYAPPKLNKAYSFGGPGRLQVCECPGAPMKPKVTRSEVCEAPCAQSKQTKVSVAEVCEAPCAQAKQIKASVPEVCEAPCAQSKQTKVSVAEVCEAPCAQSKPLVSQVSGVSAKPVSKPSGTKATDQDLGVKHSYPPRYADGIPSKKPKLSDEPKTEADGDKRDVKSTEETKKPTPELVKEEEKEIAKATSEAEETLGNLTEASSEAVTTGVEFTETATSESQTVGKAIVIEEPEVSETIEEETTEAEEIVDTQVVPEKISLAEPCDGPCKDVMPCDKMGAPCMQRKKAAEKDVDYSEDSSKVPTISVERGSDPIVESAISTFSEIQAVIEPESASFVERGSDPIEVSREDAVIEPAEESLFERQGFADLEQQTVVLQPQTADLGQQTVSVVEPPITVLEQPIVVEQPVAVLSQPEPVAIEIQPVAVVPQPVAVVEQPVFVEQPVVVEQPVAVVEQPVAIVEQPAAVIEQPVAIVSSPVAVVPSPVAVVPSPVAVVPSPVAVVPSPVAVVPSPISVVPSPVSVVPTPIDVVPSPVAVVPSPVAVIPSPIAVIEQPVAVIEQPVPVVPQPVAEVEKPIIVERGSDPIVDIEISEKTMPEIREATIATEEPLQKRKPSSAGQAITGTYSGTFPFQADTKLDTMDEPPAGLQVTTTITSSGNLEVITEGAEGIIETTLVYRDDGTIEVLTEITEFPGELSTEPLSEPSKSLTKSERRSRVSEESKNLFDEQRKELAEKLLGKESIMSGTSGLTDVDSTYTDPTITTPITQADDEMFMDKKDASVELETGKTLEQQTSSVPISVALTDKMSSEETAIGTEEIQQEDKEGGTADELEIAAIVTEEISHEDKIGNIPDESDDRGMGTEEISLEDQSQFATEESDDRAIATEIISQQDQDGSSPDKADITAATSSIPMTEIGTDETPKDVITEALKAQTSDGSCQSSIPVEESCQCCECRDVGVLTSKDTDTITDEKMTLEDIQPKSEIEDQVPKTDSELLPAKDVKEEGDTLGSLQELLEPTNDKDVGTSDIPVDERNKEASVQSSGHGQGESPRRSEDKKPTEIPVSPLQIGSSGERQSPKRRSSRLSDAQCDCPGICQCVVCSPEIINKRLATTGSSQPPGGKSDQICCCNLTKEKTSSSERRRSVPPQTAQVYLQTELSKPKVEVLEQLSAGKHPENCTCIDCICKPCTPCPRIGPSATEAFLKSTNLETVQSPICKCSKKTVEGVFEPVDAKTSPIPRSTADIATSEVKSRSDDKTPTIPESEEKSTADMATSDITRPIQEAGEQTISTEFKVTSPRISTPKHSPDSIPEDYCDCPLCKCLDEEPIQVEIRRSSQDNKLQTIDEKGDSVCECPLCVCKEAEEKEEEQQVTQISKEDVPEILDEVVATDETKTLDELVATDTTTTSDEVVETDERKTIDAVVSPIVQPMEDKLLSAPSSEVKVIPAPIEVEEEPIKVEEETIEVEEAPIEVVEEPVEVVEEPVEVVEEPVEVVEEPVEVVEEPVEVIEEPVEVVEEPVEVVEEPVEVVEEPVEVVEEPVEVVEEPVEVVEEPVEVVEEPVEVVEEPVEVVEEPVEVVEEPVEVVEEPVEVVEEPVEVVEEPIEVEETPIEVEEAPIEVEEAPIEVAVPIEVEVAIKVEDEPIKVKEICPALVECQSRAAAILQATDVKKYESPRMSPVGTELTCPAFKLLTRKCQAGKKRTKCVADCPRPSECQIECQTDPELYSHKTPYKRVSHPSNCECVDCLCFPKIQELAQTVEVPIDKDEKQVYQVQTKCGCINAQNAKKYLERSKVGLSNASSVLSCNCVLCQCTPCADPKKAGKQDPAEVAKKKAEIADMCNCGDCKCRVCFPKPAASSEKKSSVVPAAQSQAAPGNKKCCCPGPCTCGAGVCPMEEIQRQLNELKEQLTKMVKLKEQPSKSSERQIKILDENGECDCEICQCPGAGVRSSNVIATQSSSITEECDCEVCNCPGAVEKPSKMSGKSSVALEECDCEVCDCPGSGAKSSKMISIQSSIEEECDCVVCDCPGAGEKPSKISGTASAVDEECDCEVCNCPGAAEKPSKISGKASTVDEECDCQICECPNAPGVGDKPSKLTCDCSPCKCCTCGDPTRKTATAAASVQAKESAVKTDSEYHDLESCSCETCECPNKEQASQVKKLDSLDHPDDCDCAICKCPEGVTQTEGEDAPAKQTIGDAQTECTCPECLCPGGPPKKETGVTFRQNAGTHPEGCTCEDCKCPGGAERKEETTDTATHPAGCICETCLCAAEEKHGDGCACPECACVDCFFKTNVELHAADCKCDDCRCQECPKRQRDTGIRSEGTGIRSEGSPKGDGCRCETCKCTDCYFLQPKTASAVCKCDPCKCTDCPLLYGASQETAVRKEEGKTEEGKAEVAIVAAAPLTNRSCHCLNCRCDVCAEGVTKTEAEVVAKASVATASCHGRDCGCPDCAGKSKKDVPPETIGEPTTTTTTKSSNGTELKEKSSQPPPFELPIRNPCNCDNCPCVVCSQKRGLAGDFGLNQEEAPLFSAPRRMPCTCPQCTCVNCNKEGGLAPEAMSSPQLNNKTTIERTHTSTQDNSGDKANKSDQTNCKCLQCACIPCTEEAVSKSVGEVTSKHEEGCACPSCCGCSASKVEIVDISKLDNATLMKKIKTDKNENCECREQMKDIKRALNKIKCVCTSETETKPIKNKQQIKQASSFGQTMSGLKLALCNLQEKCKVKDRMIEAMTRELKLRASSNTLEKVINTSAKEVPDYDKAEDVKSLQQCEEGKPVSTNVLFEGKVGQTKDEQKEDKPEKDTKHCQPCYDIKMSKAIGTEKPTKRKSKSSKVCKCGKSHRDNKPNENVNLDGFEITDIRRITIDTIIIKWQPPRADTVTGYDIFVNGVNKSKVMSSGRTSAMIHSLDLTATIQITIYAVTKCGRCEPPAMAIYEIK